LLIATKIKNKMPIFEYKCKECDTVYDVLHKSTNDTKDVICPKCKSSKSIKLISTFSSKISSDSGSGGCENGSCGMPSFGGGCSNGMCGLN
jgi:putative FmdB family regulatory protein